MEIYMYIDILLLDEFSHDMGPYRPILDPYGPILGPYRPIWARMGPARAHAPHETISEINPFFEKKAPVRTNHVSTDHLSAPDKNN